MNYASNIKIKSIIIYTVLAFFAFMFIFPYIWMISSSLKKLSDIYSDSMSLVPKDVVTGKFYLSFENYLNVFVQVPLLPKLFLNTFVIAVVNTFLNLFFNSLAAYSFARFKYPGRDFIFKLMLTGMMVPGTILLIPNYYLVNMLGLYNSQLSLIVPFMMSVYNIFLMRQAFLNSLKEIEESASLEGCSRFGIFYRISLPQQKPVLVTLGIFTFLWNYNNYMYPLLYINDEQKTTLQIGLASIMMHNRGANYEILLAASVVVSVPLIALFAIFQKYIVEGITLGSLKG